MKKMQCEVCGSNEIRKVSDEIFECQSCGVQYSKDEVQKLLVEITGSIKIDHSREVENTIKRAEQFANDGNNRKAEEYYDKALDLDSDNIEARDGVKKAINAQKFEDYYVVQPKINPKDNVANFLKQLATIENIACDIYKEISIKNITEKYYTFAFVKGKYRCNWSLTACRRYYENETIYKEEYDYTLKRRVTKPETKRIERIERTPMNGTKIYETEQLILASESLSADVFSVAQSFATELVDNFESLQADKYSTYEPKSINVKDLVEVNGSYTYNNTAIDVHVDHSVYNEKKKSMREVADQRAADEIRAGIDCDFCEGISATGEVLSETVAYICLPVQIISYSYKNKDYVAISDLISNSDTMPMIFPCDTEMHEKKESLKNDNDQIQKTSGLAIGGWILFIGGLILWLIGGTAESGGIMVFGIIAWIVSYFLLIPDFIKKRKLKKKYLEDSEQAKKELYNPRKLQLAKSYRQFFNEYQKNSSLKDSVSAVSTNSIVIEKTQDSISLFGPIKDFSPDAIETELANETLSFKENTNPNDLIKDTTVQNGTDVNNDNEKGKKKKIIAVLWGLCGCLFVGLIVLGCILENNKSVNVDSISETEKYSSKSKQETIDTEQDENITTENSSTNNTSNTISGSTYENEGNVDSVTTNSGSSAIKHGESKSTNSSNSVSKPTASSSTTQTISKPTVNKDPCANGHDWVATTKTIHHDEVGHYEMVQVSPSKTWYRCPCCGNEYYDINEYYTHFDNSHKVDNNGNSLKWLRNDYIHGTIHAEYEEKWIVDKKAYDEKITTYKCSRCGAKK